MMPTPMASPGDANRTRRRACQCGYWCLESSPVESGGDAVKCLLIGGAGFIGSHLAQALVALGHEVSIIDNRMRNTGIPSSGESGGDAVKCLLIGGAGFIGSHLAQALVALGHEVSIIDNRMRNTGIPLPNACRVCDFDICEMPALIDFWNLTPWNWCFHLAAIVGVPNVEREPGRTATVASVSATWLHAIKATKHFVASTSELYGGHCPITSEDAPVVIPDLTAPRAAYAVGKVWQETTAILSGQSYVIGRFHNVYGPGMGTDHVIPRFCLQLRDPGDHVTVEDPTAIRAFCYIADAVQGILAAMTLDRVIVNIGNPEEPVTMR